MITTLSEPSMDLPEYSVHVDPTWAEIKGTESTVRYNSDTSKIGVGFNRCLYIGCDSIYSNTSRLAFSFSSSDNSIATVSAYGTVNAYKTGQVTIYVIRKQGYGLIASFSVEFDIVSSGTGTVLLSTDINNPTSGSNNGTQISIGGLPGGNNINISYTRSMCIISGPSLIRQDYIWTSSNPNVAYVNTYGYVTGISIGSVTITATLKLNSQWIGQFSIIVQ